LGKHPHIVRCHHVFKADVGPEVFFVLELVAAAEGKRDASLRSWLTPGKPLSVAQALLFALHIARGMRHATAKIPELVHRDLKPENLLIGREGLLRVTDLGLATVTRSSTEGRGTCLYMAPEQWDQTDVDLRADIYKKGDKIGGRYLDHQALMGEVCLKRKT
jgi:serine/threonine-protein kinase